VVAEACHTEPLLHACCDIRLWWAMMQAVVIRARNATCGKTLYAGVLQHEV